ncbi:hypothetical protein KQX54_011732 [Cotesia glomerata]|uniref:Uncharacterized protein n=1 Tax=Cotesia glomerata TaxID=32391 RepID=A0AAV7J3A0_COTGL|nr:hypothetical protein KQX54_011732 [Cotesia glomerata]
MDRCYVGRFVCVQVEEFLEKKIRSYEMKECFKLFMKEGENLVAEDRSGSERDEKWIGAHAKQGRGKSTGASLRGKGAQVNQRGTPRDVQERDGQ